MGLDTGGNSSLHSASNITVQDEGTCCAWVRMDTFATSGAVAGIWPYHGFEMEDQFGTNRAGHRFIANVTNSTAALADNTLYHVALTWKRDGSNTDQEIWIDGVLDKSATVTYIAPTNNEFAIGNMEGLSAGAVVDAHIDDVRRYNRVLKPAEIQTIFAAKGRDGIVHGLLDRWPIDEGAPGTTVAATGGVKNVARNQNAQDSNQGSPVYSYLVPLSPRKRVA